MLRRQQTSALLTRMIQVTAQTQELAQGVPSHPLTDPETEGLPREPISKPYTQLLTAKIWGLGQSLSLL